tara:strand:+ start:352 stop:954 length:603 start_codon:yes stop_codon:yes gene_type:complete
MYEVFINDRPLIISNNISIDNDVIIFNDDINWFEIVSSLINGSKKVVYIKTKSLDCTWQSFLNQFKIIKAAGGLVFNNEKILFIYRNKKWDLPKGKLENNESIKSCALREVKEECGIKNLNIVDFVGETYHIYMHSNELILKVTYWYSMNSFVQENLQPQIEEGIEKVEWKNIRQTKNLLSSTYPNISKIIKKFMGSYLL